MAANHPHFSWRGIPGTIDSGTPDAPAASHRICRGCERRKCIEGFSGEPGDRIDCQTGYALHNRGRKVTV